MIVAPGALFAAAEPAPSVASDWIVPVVVSVALVGIASGAWLLGRLSGRRHREQQGRRPGAAAPASAPLPAISGSGISTSQPGESPQFLREIIDHSTAVIFVKDREGRYLLVNSQFESVTGKPFEEILGRTDAELFPAESAATFRANDLRVLEAGTPIEFEEEVELPGGTLTVLSLKFPLLDAAGKPHATCGIATDISGRKRAEERVRESEERFRTIVDHAPEAIVVLDVDAGRFVDANTNAERLFRLSREQLLKIGPFEMSPGHLQPFGEKQIERAMAGEAPVFEWIHTDADRNEIPCEIRLVRLPSSTGNVIRGSIIDITERKRAEKVLLDIARGVSAETGEPFFRSFVEHLARALDADYAHVAELVGAEKARLHTVAFYGNGKFLEPVDVELPESPFEGLLGRSVRSYPERARELFPRCGLLVDLDIHAWVGSTIASSDGTPIGLTAVMFRRPIENTKLAESMLQIFAARAGAEMERKRSAEEREQLLAQLFQSQKMEAVGTLASGVAHDFNNVVTAILGYTDLIAGAVAKDSQVMKSVVGIRNASRHARDVTRALMTFSRKAPSERSPQRLDEVVRDSLGMLRRVLPASIELVTDVADDEEIWSEVDATQIQQVIVNLSVNARDAMPEGGQLTISLHSRRRGRNDTDDWARLVVEDTGSGIPGPVRERIFDPFFTTKSREGGTGLGMAIVHGIVMNHGGHIDIDSRPDGGARVTVDLPTCPSPTHEGLGVTDPPVPTGAGETLLLAEDNRQVRAILASVLKSAGYRVFQAEDGVQLMDLFERWRDRASLAILDADLPRKSGLACAREILDTQPGFRVILISGLPEVADACRDLANAYFMAKPFEVSELAALVQRVLGQRDTTGTGEDEAREQGENTAC